MNHILIVDQPMVADAFALLLHQHTATEITIAEASDLYHAPRNALILIEVFLASHYCGLLHAHSLQNGRPDLTPIVWTNRPAPIHPWAASTYRLPGFLDKRMTTTCCFQWLAYAQNTGTAWPKDLLQTARMWEQEVAVRLRELTPDMWHLWLGLGLVQNKSNEELSEMFGWSRRTLERRLHDLYEILGVSGKAEAVIAAGSWQLITTRDGTFDWIPLVDALFLRSVCEIQC
jgi:DNA-binding NarL/FixJ family response regulator